MNFKPRSESFKNYLKLKSGESAKGVFRGEPFDFRQHWHNNRSAVCTGTDCILCAEGNNSSFRFRINFVTNENGTYTAKVFEQGGKTYDALRSLHESDYDLERTVIKITRSGSRNDTTYSVVPVPRGDVTDEMEKKISEVKLNDLVKSQNAGDVSDVDNEDVPF